MRKLTSVVRRAEYERGARAVTLVVRVKHQGAWRRFPAVYGANGRVKPGHGLVAGKAVAFDSPAYEIRYIENRKPRYMAAGRNASDAEAERKRIETQSTAVVVAEAAGVKVAEITERRTIKVVAEAYHKDAHAREAFEAEVQARQVMAEFLKGCIKTFIDEVGREDILRFHAALRKRGLGERTVANKHARLRSVFRFAGIDVKEVFPPEPKYEAKLPTIYAQDQISTIFAEADGSMRMALMLTLKLGLREREATHAEFPDIDWTARVFRVRSKPTYKHKIKDGEERDIPIPADFLEELKAYRESLPEAKRNRLIAPTATGRPDEKLLQKFKGLVRRTGLDCGHCKGCQGAWGCSEWTLHRFRRTYLSMLLRNSVDLRTVQHYAGHSDLASTMRYLRPAEGAEVQAKVDAIRWGA